MGKEKICENLADNIGLENFKRIDKKQTKIRNTLKNVFTTVLVIFSITGIVFAKEISTKVYENFYGTGNGVGKAMEEGYIEKNETQSEPQESTITNKETGTVVEDIETSIKIDEFVMDDFSLSMTFEVEFSDKMKDMIEPEKIGNMDFSDMVIYDENYVILNIVSEKRFNEFCKEHNLEYNFETMPEEKSVNSGINAYRGEKTGNSVKYICNLYTEGDTFPKSKKIYVDMNEIRISTSVEIKNGDEEMLLKGDWNFEADVPEKMYNRANIIYVQKSTTDKDFNVIAATVYDTGMDISLDFKVEPIPPEPTTPELEFYKTLPEGHEFKSIEMTNYIYGKQYKMPEYQEYMEKRLKMWQFDKYLENSNGEQFSQSVGPRANGSGRIDENNIYHYNGMFDLTKYDMTDEIKMYIDYHGRKAEIILERKTEE